MKRPILPFAATFLDVKIEQQIIKIIDEMENKRKNLTIPRNCSIRPVLIHVNGLEESVLDERYFDKVIDFGQLLELKG